MAEKIDQLLLDDFQRITSYDVKSFFASYIDFTENHYSNILNFYSGSSDVLPTIAFNRLKYLINEQKKIIDVIILNSVSLEEYRYWVITENVEDIGHTLETANNASKWLRSVITKSGYKQQVIVDYTASQNEDLEQIERKVIKSSNSRDSWVDTALQNGLREEDYSLAGNYLIKIVFKNNASIFLNGIVDNIDSPEKTYGLDIDQAISFDNDDLVVLGYESTIKQCASILTALEREHDPAYPDRGVDKKNILRNIAAISYQTIFRDLAGNFATDDSFKSFSILDIKRQADGIFLEFQVETKAGDAFKDKIQL